MNGRFRSTALAGETHLSARTKVDTRPVHGGVVSAVVVAGDEPIAGLRCVERIASLDWPHDLLEIVIVGPARAFDAQGAEQCSRPGVQIRIVDTEAGVSPAAARNKGADRARGEWLAFLDPSATPDAGWLRAALRAMRANANIAAVEGDVPSGDGNRTWAIVVETKAFRWVGGFDEEHCRELEHVDLAWRMMLAGLGVERDRSPERPSAVASIAARSRGRTEMLYKNLADENLNLAMPANSFEPSPSLVDARARTQALRQVPDFEVVALFGVPPTPRRRILVATPDVLQPKMAGPAIRAFQIALELSHEHDVELVSTVGCDLSHPSIAMSLVDDDQFKRAVSRAEVVIIQGHLIDGHPWLRTVDQVLVADIYDPFHLEVLEQSRDMALHNRRVVLRLTVEVLNEQLARGDFFLCASEKQRDFWLGQLSAVGRLNASTYDDDENLESLIAVAPFGVDEVPPVATRRALRGVVPGIGENDKVILWGGGVYNWFDPLTLLRAVDKLRRRLPDVRLYFMGMAHPNPLVPTMQMAYKTTALAEELGLVGTHVFFNEGWVDYDDRQNYLLESDVGVSTHLDRVETAFSFRTRILDYLWASLPVVASDGDGFADVIRKRGFGLVVPPLDIDALENALYTLLTNDEQRAACRRAIEDEVAEMRWVKVLEPLLAFCRHPARARDLVDPRQRYMVGDPLAQTMWGHRGWKHTVRVVIDHARHGELGDLKRKVHMRLRRWRDPHSAGPGGRTDTF